MSADAASSFHLSLCNLVMNYYSIAWLFFDITSITQVRWAALHNFNLSVYLIAVTGLTKKKLYLSIHLWILLIIFQKNLKFVQNSGGSKNFNSMISCYSIPFYESTKGKSVLEMKNYRYETACNFCNTLLEHMYTHWL